MSSDMEAVAEVAHRHGLPLIVDNTFATPYLLRPIWSTGRTWWSIPPPNLSAGMAPVMGGVIVDGGTVRLGGLRRVSPA